MRVHCAFVLALIFGLAASTALAETPAAEKKKYPCEIQLCQPKCVEVTQHLKLGAFAFPYPAHQCTADEKCNSANAACKAQIEAKVAEAQAAKGVMDKAWQAVLDAEKEWSKKKDSLAAATKVSDAAQTTLKGAQAALAVKTGAVDAAKKKQSVAQQLVDEVTQASSAEAKKAEAAASAAKQAEDARKLSEDDVKAAVKAFNEAILAHCDAEAKHGDLVKKVGHDNLKQSGCREVVKFIAAAPVK
jgi:hypothetical protein